MPMWTPPVQERLPIEDGDNDDDHNDDHDDDKDDEDDDDDDDEDFDYAESKVNLKVKGRLLFSLCSHHLL